MKIQGETITGVVAELDGKYFGLEYADGHCTCYGFVDIDMAEIGDPEFCKVPTDMTYKDSLYYDQLCTATLRKVTKLTTYVFE